MSNSVLSPTNARTPYLSVPPSWDKPTRRPVIWINGWPAVGKASVAGFIKTLLGISEVVLVNEDGEDDLSGGSAVELDQHARCADDPAVEEDPLARGRRTTAIRRYILSEESLCRTTVFTACQPRTRKGQWIAAEYATAAKSVDRLFIPINLTCSEQENIRRLGRQRECSVNPEKVLKDPNLLVAVREVGLFEFTEEVTDATAPPQRPQLLRSFHTTDLVRVADAGSCEPETSAAVEAGGSPRNCQAKPYHDKEDPASMMLTLDVSRMTSMQAGFSIISHVQDMEERRMCRVRAAELKEAALQRKAQAMVQTKKSLCDAGELDSYLWIPRPRSALS
ncbi:hypothetical protein MCOR25_004246 [Pyricularia grisea]|uniref:Uncharacterized protein n=1 Tax=Pyricularia grisea TaxID=148305 RepID=A0A6P8BCA2_PYRGI|nr:uncharacterized protein PgNI_04363 [Pyricularia grisea]KAI6370253.1 hypothetical protein MCOR25_004246 [Pyricularia grisea]TLD13486.1 hypothetical protein PgNI_04363 [Pyricularia grisea]